MYSGTIVPLVTPVDDAGNVSETCVARLIESVRGEVTALMPALSSGEGWALTEQQWQQMISATRAHSSGLPVLAGIQLATTAAVVARAQHTATLGVDAVVVTSPFGEDLTQDRIYRHFAALHSTVSVPLFLYNETAISGNRIELDTLRKICRLPGIVGIKESSGAPELTRRIAADLPQVPVFEGWENLLLEARGVAGFIGPLANLEPALCNAMLTDPTAARQAEVDDACARYGLLTEDWYRPVKAELVRRGVIDSDRVVAAKAVAT
ncbi:MAG: dihydrodipicolinate synthase family protein [Pseudonocardiaceae bacterium]